MTSADYKKLPRAIEENVAKTGLSPQSVWLDREDVLSRGVRRCDAMLRMVGAEVTSFSLLDVGCGAGFGIAYLEQHFASRMKRYCGVDVSSLLLDAARRSYPGHEFVVRDIIEAPLPERAFDFTVINGVLGPKFSLTHEAMEAFAMALLKSAWRSTGIAMSFNVMSAHVDWTREDLFHWPLDRMAGFCTKELSRHFNVFADYGLYEYTVQVFREPRPPSGPPPAAWMPA